MQRIASKALRSLGIAIAGVLLFGVVIVLSPFLVWDWIADHYRHKDLRERISAELLPKGVRGLLLFDGRDAYLGARIGDHVHSDVVRVIDHTCHDKLLQQIVAQYKADVEAYSPLDEPLTPEQDDNHERSVLRLVTFMPQAKDDRSIDLLFQGYDPDHLQTALEELKGEMKHLASAWDNQGASRERVYVIASRDEDGGYIVDEVTHDWRASISSYEPIDVVNEQIAIYDDFGHKYFVGPNQKFTEQRLVAGLKAVDVGKWDFSAGEPFLFDTGKEEKGELQDLLRQYVSGRQKLSGSQLRYASLHRLVDIAKDCID